MGTPITNFGLVTVSTTYGAGDTSVELTAGHGAKLPATTGGYQYPMTWWDSTNYPQPADDPNVEIVMVTARSGDTLTVTRAQEGTSASTKNTGSGAVYRMSLGTTKAMWESLRVVKNTHQGLALQTDRDSPDAHKKVEITALEYLVMDDGTISTNASNEWTGKVADITVSGAAGLDAGAEEASYWYEIYAIEKEDGTKNLLLHKARRWSDEASTNVITEDAWQNVASASSNEFVSQGFKLSTSGQLRYARVKLQKVGSPAGFIVCAVYSDNAGVPGSGLSVAHYLDASRLPTSETWVQFNFPHSAPTLSASPTQYHLILGTTVHASNYIQWRMDGSAAPYADGAKATWNGTTWTADTDDDMTLEVGLEVDNASVTMPSGYTKKCLLGWVYNDGSSNFLPFIQRGRTRRTTALTESANLVVELDGTAQVVRPVAPAIESITALVACAGTGTQAGIAALSDLSALDVSSSGDTTGTQAMVYSGTTTTRPGVFSEVIVRAGFFMAHGTNGAKLWMCGFSW